MVQQIIEVILKTSPTILIITEGLRFGKRKFSNQATAFQHLWPRADLITWKDTPITAMLSVHACFMHWCEPWTRVEQRGKAARGLLTSQRRCLSKHEYKQLGWRPRCAGECGKQDSLGPGLGQLTVLSVRQRCCLQRKSLFKAMT